MTLKGSALQVRCVCVCVYTYRNDDWAQQYMFANKCQQRTVSACYSKLPYVATTRILADLSSCVIKCNY